MSIIVSNNQYHVNILIFLCFMYTDLKMTRLEKSKQIVLNTYAYGNAALMTENVWLSLHSIIVT